MEFKGTKGPWINTYPIITSEEEDVCEIYVHLEAYMDNQNSISEKTAESNAKLIACAPETIINLNISNELLKSILSLFESNMALSTKFGIVSQIESNDNIIKKATE